MPVDELSRVFWILLLSLAVNIIRVGGNGSPAPVSNDNLEHATSTDDYLDFNQPAGRNQDQSGWYPPCDPKKPAPCGSSKKLECIDYGRLYPDSAEDVHICDCETPDFDSTTQCICKADDEKIYSRWEYQDKSLKNPPAMGDNYKIAAAGYSRPGCYLAYGETCRIEKAAKTDAETHYLCKHGLYCKPFMGTTNWGFCVNYAMVTSRITWLWPFVLVLLYPFI